MLASLNSSTLGHYGGQSEAVDFDGNPLLSTIGSSLTTPEPVVSTDSLDQESPYMQHMTYILVVLHASVFVSGLIGNALVCLSVYRNKSLQTVTNYYIVNLAVADFLVILICLPPTVYWDIKLTWNFGLILCKLVLYLQSISVSVSVLTLTCISLDRWYAICRPLKFGSTKHRAKITIALIWVSSMLIASPDVIYLTTRAQYEEDDKVYMDCTYSWPESTTKVYQLCIVSVLFVIPFVLMTISYSNIVNVLWRNDNITESFEPQRDTIAHEGHPTLAASTSQASSASASSLGFPRTPRSPQGEPEAEAAWPPSDSELELGRGNLALTSGSGSKQGSSAILISKYANTSNTKGRPRPSSSKSKPKAEAKRAATGRGHNLSLHQHPLVSVSISNSNSISGPSCHNLNLNMNGSLNNIRPNTNTNTNMNTNLKQSRGQQTRLLQRQSSPSFETKSLMSNPNPNKNTNSNENGNENGNENENENITTRNFNSTSTCKFASNSNLNRGNLDKMETETGNENNIEVDMGVETASFASKSSCRSENNIIINNENNYNDIYNRIKNGNCDLDLNLNLDFHDSNCKDLNQKQKQNLASNHQTRFRSKSMQAASGAKLNTQPEAACQTLESLEWLNAGVGCDAARKLSSHLRDDGDVLASSAATITKSRASGRSRSASDCDNDNNNICSCSVRITPTSNLNNRPTTSSKIILNQPVSVAFDGRDSNHKCRTETLRALPRLGMRPLEPNYSYKSNNDGRHDHEHDHNDVNETLNNGHVDVDVPNDNENDHDDDDDEASEVIVNSGDKFEANNDDDGHQRYRYLSDQEKWTAMMPHPVANWDANKSTKAMAGRIASQPHLSANSKSNSNLKFGSTIVDIANIDEQHNKASQPADQHQRVNIQISTPIEDSQIAPKCHQTIYADQNDSHDDDDEEFGTDFDEDQDVEETTMNTSRLMVGLESSNGHVHTKLNVPSTARHNNNCNSSSNNNNKIVIAQANGLKSSANSNSNPFSHSNARFCKLIESRKKAAKMLIVIVIMFGLCYLPVHFLNILRYTIGLPQNDFTTFASLVSHWLCYFNSAINPLIYNLMSGKFRHEFAIFLCRCLRQPQKGANNKQNKSNKINKVNRNRRR